MSHPLVLGKCWEGATPYLVWQAAGKDEGGGARRGFLIVDARQQTRGARLASAKPADLKATGSLASLLRKLGPTTVHAIGETDSGLWLVMGKGDAAPDVWLQLSDDMPPELRIVTDDGTALMRRSNQGTYTKRRSLGLTPPQADSMKPMMLSWPNERPQTSGEAASAPGALPEYQRVARDRLARRLKTIKKSAGKESARGAAGGKGAAAAEAARRLAAALHGIAPGTSRVALADPDDPDAPSMTIELDPTLSPGANLERLYHDVKRLKRTVAVATARVATTGAAADRLATDLERIRGTPMSETEVAAILARHGLTPPPASAPEAKAAGKHKAPPRYARAFQGKQGETPVTILVGRAAADNDELTKRAQGNDWWLHVVGVTGSHVVIPARALRGAPTPGLLRQAAILALHFSKLRQGKAGEVYVTQRQHVVKKKGMAAGLWQVVKAETLNVRYDDAELRAALGDDGDGGSDA
jgi:hypothetical protein